MRFFATALCLSALFLLQSCVQTTQLVVNSDDVAMNAEKATIVVLRPSVFGYSVRNDVYWNGLLMGYTGPKGYLRWDVSPGVHTIGSSAGNFDFVKIEAKAGETYYFKQSQRLGMVISNVALVPVSEEFALKRLQNLSKANQVEELPESVYSK